MELTLIIPAIIILPVLIFIFAWLIPEWINDVKWEKYDYAYRQWEKNGKKGNMPESKDFGYQHIKSNRRYK